MEHTVYIASRTEAGGIIVCRLSDDGKITAVSSAAADRPAYLCRDGSTLYALLREPFQLMSGLAAYRINSDSSLSPAGAPESTHGLYSAHIYARNGNVWCANYIDGTVLKMPDRLVAFGGCGPDRSRQLSSHPHCITPSPDGKYLCITDLGTDRIHVMTGNLEPVSEAALPAGSGPRHLVFSHDGRYAFSSNEMGCSVSVMRYSDGVLVPEYSVPTVPEDSRSGASASAIRLSGDGKHLYVSNRGHNSIAVFSVEDGKLSLDGFIPSFGDSPRDFALVGEYLICGNELSDNVTVFSLRDGIPQSPVDEISIPMPWCILPADSHA